MGRGAQFQLYIYIFLLLLGCQVRAGGMVEPYAGYYEGNYNSHIRDTVGGTIYGLRFGHHGDWFMAGLDVLSGRWTAKTSPVFRQTPLNVGIFAGFHHPKDYVRVYATYDFADRLDEDNGVSKDTLLGTDFKLGFGFQPGIPKIPFSFLNHFTFNIEYMYLTYTENKSGRMSSIVPVHLFGVTIGVPILF